MKYNFDEAVDRRGSNAMKWLDLDEENDEILVSKARVRLNDGVPYGSGGHGFFRINIGCSRETLREALRRIESALK